MLRHIGTTPQEGLSPDLWGKRERARSLVTVREKEREREVGRRGGRERG